MKLNMIMLIVAILGGSMFVLAGAFLIYAGIELARTIFVAVGALFIVGSLVLTIVMIRMTGRGRK